MPKPAQTPPSGARQKPPLSKSIDDLVESERHEAWAKGDRTARPDWLTDDVVKRLSEALGGRQVAGPKGYHHGGPVRSKGYAAPRMRQAKG